MILYMDYKLLTKIQTIIINKYLPKIIDADQGVFMKDHYIGSNILELQPLIHYVGENNIACPLLCIDI